VAIFRNLPLRSKLRAILMGTCGIALVLACAAFLTLDYLSFRRQSLERLQVLGGLLAGQCAPAISFNDAKLARDILSKVEVEQEILAAGVFDREGRLFARYLRSDAPSDLPVPAPGPEDLQYRDGHLVVFSPVRADQEAIGTVYVRSDLRGLRSRLQTNALIVGLAFLVSLVIALGLSSRLERVVTHPIGRLAETVRRVSTERDYSARAEKTSQDELGTLIDGFNDMLSQIQVRDSALQQGRNDLELRVNERTAQLQRSNRELETEIVERRRAEQLVRESEQRVRTLVDYAPEALFIFDADAGRFIDVNTRAERLFGRSREEFLRIGPLELCPPVQPDGRPSERWVEEKVGEAVAGGTPVFEWTCLDSTGKTIPCEAHLVRLPGKDRHVLASVVDITRRKEVERMKNEFISTVSHELRTPLTSIQGSLGLIVNGVLGALPPDARPMIEIAHKNSQRLVLLINDILDIEKIAAGKMNFAMRPVDLMAVVEQAVEANRSYAAQYGVTLAIGEALPGTRVLGDPDRLHQVLTNLLSNASKFSPREGTVRVSVERRDGLLRVSVADQGPGLSDEFRGRVFQMFSQADSSDVRQKGGTGLGLAICKAITEKHGGRIAYESRSGEGTTFWIELPELR
jgi:PAS domain S-box-containing protein